MKKPLPGVDIDAIHKKRKKKCKGCGETFTFISSLQRACGIKCAVEIGKRISAKNRKRDLRERREKLKTRRDLVKEAQVAFNAYIRERDRDLPCISCNRYHRGQWHAGHYEPTSSHPELRFNELNVHKQCAPCNDHLSGNLIEYRKGLIARIGTEKVEWLEGPHEPAKYTADELKLIRDTYRVKLKELKWRHEKAGGVVYSNETGLIR